ncbi:MAG: hypothetical protein OEY89_03460 [Gammaproteobacteria bacterium]|nr:hypothetical protein [Gammaproteobacteria bacterium]
MINWTPILTMPLAGIHDYYQSNIVEISWICVVNSWSAYSFCPVDELAVLQNRSQYFTRYCINWTPILTNELKH